MGWQQSDTWQWWLETGFDGIAGGVLGGLATGGAVWLTLRHERKMADRAVLRTAATALRATSLEVLLAPGDGVAEESFWKAWRARLFHDAVTLRDLAAADEPRLSEDLEEFTSEHFDWMVAGPVVDEHRSLATSSVLNSYLAPWVAGKRPSRRERKIGVDWRKETEQLMAEARAARRERGHDREPEAKPDESRSPE